MSTHKIGNADIFVKVTGEGEPALLLHGVPDTADLWDPLIDNIKHEFRCFAPDLPGFYRSDIPENFQFDFEHYADFVDALVERLEIQTPLTLIIHDWGGLYGMLWACKYPHKVKRIVGGSFPFSHLYKWHEWATIWRTPIVGELSMLLMNWPLFKWELRRSSKKLTEQDMRETYARILTRWQTRWSILKMYRSAPVHLFTHWASQQAQLVKQVPFDVIWGQDDPYVPPHLAYLMHPHSVTVVPDCGHWTPREALDVFSARVLEELR